jgi:hypothetical protein
MCSCPLSAHGKYQYDTASKRAAAAGLEPNMLNVFLDLPQVPSVPDCPHAPWPKKESHGNVPNIAATQINEHVGNLHQHHTAQLCSC